ncbi:Uncharacterized protein PCOAH_00012640 [Plasmodium coatneyi]|uniref:Uncharacterized protein n=1 Tax=Plasmodium coatneyi TaxID=208452 RepID=A0A1B1DVT9_9APIC|nr:Uncharacterized protein PCOAH_00012640 [Plasmodium coatneyi]ANQ06888.1 Uncharacterized protein PCOAH_00012640 [Plasmodium coatneyi]
MIFKQIAEKASQVLMGSDAVTQSDLKVKTPVGKETKSIIPHQCNGADTAGGSTHVNAERDKLHTKMSHKKRIHERAKKKVNLFLKRYKLEGRKKKKKKKTNPSKLSKSCTSSTLLLSRAKNRGVKKLKKITKLEKIKDDYFTILNLHKEFVDKYEEEKSFRETIKSYHSNELAKDCSYAVFFFRLFVRGEYLNGEALTEALTKDNRKPAESATHVPPLPVDDSNPDKKSQIKKKKFKNAIAFLNGRNTRLLMCDYLKVLLNNIQNESEVSTNFLILEYVASHDTKEQKNYTQMINLHKLGGHVKEEQSTLSYSLSSVKEAGTSPFPSGGPIIENAQSQHLENNPGGSNAQKNGSNGNNGGNPTDVTTSGGRNGANADSIQMNELLFNRILSNFVTELRSFFFSVIAKIQTSQVVSQLIVAFAEICLTLTPYYVHIINLIEILSDFASIIPVRYMDYLMTFFQRNKNIFIEKYKEFQNFVIFNDPIKTQSVGARLIGFIKNLQKKNALNRKQKSSNVFFLHMLLSECLPINHLGFCNRQSAKNNFHLLFYDSMQRCKNTANDESLIFNDFELGIQENVKNHAKIRELILAEIDARCVQASTNSGGDAKTDGDHSDQVDQVGQVGQVDQVDRDHHHNGEANQSTHPPNKDKKTHTNGKDSIGKRKRDEEDTPDQIPHSDKKDVKRPKRNKLSESPNEESKNYKVYLAYLYLISFIRYPEMCTAQNCAPLEDAYHSFNILMAHIKNFKKENIANPNVVREYLYNADVDFLGNIHMYNLLIRDKNFLCVFFFNILLVLNYLNVELNILTPTTDGGGPPSEYKTTDSKGKESNRSNNATHNADSTNQPASTHSSDVTRNSEEKSGNSPFSRNPSRTYLKNAKEGTSHVGSSTNSLTTKGRDNDATQAAISSNSRGNQNVTRESKEVKDVKETNPSDTKGKDLPSASERTKHILHSFVKDLLRYLGNSKGLQFFMSLLASEYCWYSWKKQLTGKPTKENLESPFEFTRLEDQSERKVKDGKHKTNPSDNAMVDENSSPLQSLIQLVHNFELLNEKMKNYYLANLDNPNLRKNPYKYTKLIRSCESGANGPTADEEEGEGSQFAAPTDGENYNNAYEVDHRGHTAKENIHETNELPDERNDVKTYPQNLRDIRKVNNFLLEINKIYLGRQAEFWELDDTDSITDLKKKKNEEKILIEKLIDKLEDYKQKMQIDNDPVNEIEESEKSKNDPVFKFRLAKLFIVKYIDLYTIVKDKEFSTDCDFLYNLMVHMDKNLAKKKILLSAQEGEVGEDGKTDGEGGDEVNGEEAKTEGEKVTMEEEPEQKA